MTITTSHIADHTSGYNGIAAIVPEGPGDREHEHEVSEQLLENTSAPQESKKEKQIQVKDEGLKESTDSAIEKKPKKGKNNS